MCIRDRCWIVNEREKNIHLWFEMWLAKQDLGIDNIFTEDVIYTESWGPKYNNRQIVKHWFQDVYKRQALFWSTDWMCMVTIWLESISRKSFKS